MARPYVRGSESERFWPKVDKSGPLPELRPELGPCWLWLAAQKNDGYGIFRRSDGTNVRAHRWAYEDAVGPIPDDLETDHLCRRRACVNPSHLEMVTHLVNESRSLPGRRTWRRERTHCRHGHEMTEDNCYWYTNKRGQLLRLCRACRRR